MAAAVENPAWIDHHARGMHFTRNHALGFDLNAALGEDHAVEAPSNHHAIAFDLAFNPRAFAQHDGLLRNDVALHVPIDAERTLELERALESHSLVNEASPLFMVASVLGSVGPLPSHHNPRSILYFSLAGGQVNGGDT